MKFKKEYLRKVIWEETGELINDKTVGTSRWSVQHRAIFKFDGKFYVTRYQKGATEMQDESPYEFEPDEIECDEVVPVEKTLTVYEKAKEANNEI